MVDKNILSAEASTGVTFTSLMAAVTLFFAGVLISQYGSFDNSIRIPLILLIISTFASIFSAAIYSNVGEEIAVGKIEKAKKNLIYSNNIFEFLGIYTLVFAIPLVINAVTKDTFLGFTTIVITLAGMTMYLLSDFSVLHKEVRNRIVKSFLAFLIISSNLLLYVSQRYEQINKYIPYEYVAGFLIILLVILVIVFCKNSSQYRVD